MPLEIMTSAASRMILSVTRSSWTYQWFQPIGGVSARVSPQTILNCRSALPWALPARSVTAYSPRRATEPVMMPVLRIEREPLGQVLGRERASAAAPVAGMR